MSNLDVRHTFPILVSAGRISGYKHILINGNNDDVDSGTVPETIWGAGGAYSFPTTATVVTLSSTSANDAAAGTGMRTLRIFGLDSNYDELEEVVTMNGVSNVTTSNTFLRVNKAVIETSGSGNQNAGVITGTINGNTVINIAATEGSTALGLYTVPRNKTLFIHNGVVTLAKVKETVATVNMCVHKEDNTNYIHTVIGISGDNSPGDFVSPRTPMRLNEKESIEMIISSIGTNDVQVTCLLHAVLVDNGYL